MVVQRIQECQCKLGKPVGLVIVQPLQESYHLSTIPDMILRK